MPTSRPRRVLAPMLLLLAAISSGCASRSLQPPPVQAPRMPPPPAELMQPVEPGLWSESVRKLFQRWQQLLTPQSPA